MKLYFGVGWDVESLLMKISSRVIDIMYDVKIQGCGCNEKAHQDEFFFG